MIVEVSTKRAIDASRSTDALPLYQPLLLANATMRIPHGRIELYAMRDIGSGEELTVNYGETHHEGRLACRCGAPRCTGRL